MKKLGLAALAALPLAAGCYAEAYPSGYYARSTVGVYGPSAGVYVSPAPVYVAPPRPVYVSPPRVYAAPHYGYGHAGRVYVGPPHRRW